MKQNKILIILILTAIVSLFLYCGGDNSSETSTITDTQAAAKAKEQLNSFFDFMRHKQYSKALDLVDFSSYEDIIDEYQDKMEEINNIVSSENSAAAASNQQNGQIDLSFVKNEFRKYLENINKLGIELSNFQVDDNSAKELEPGEVYQFTVEQTFSVEYPLDPERISSGRDNSDDETVSIEFAQELRESLSTANSIEDFKVQLIDDAWLISMDNFSTPPDLQVYTSRFEE